MDWFLYDNGLRHERVNWRCQKPIVSDAYAKFCKLKYKHIAFILSETLLPQKKHKITTKKHNYIKSMFNNHRNIFTEENKTGNSELE